MPNDVMVVLVLLWHAWGLSSRFCEYVDVDRAWRVVVVPMTLVGISAAESTIYHL